MDRHFILRPVLGDVRVFTIQLCRRLTLIQDPTERRPPKSLWRSGRYRPRSIQPPPVPLLCRTKWASRKPPRVLDSWLPFKVQYMYSVSVPSVRIWELNFGTEYHGRPFETTPT